MATKRFEKRLALKEATEAFHSLYEAFEPPIIGVSVYSELFVEVNAQVPLKEEKLQFIETAKSIVTKGVEIECYDLRSIRKYCIILKWWLER